ncbi:MAG: hypothetical protein P4L69_01895 [Desulfosporosinus sp.]|nr:hypothetical protein [Desulfosporosinus sp.]
MILAKHTALSAEISMLNELGDFLIEEIHHKRSAPPNKNGKCILLDKYCVLDPYYKNILFAGRHHRSSFDPFPSAFQCYLDDVLCDEVRYIDPMDKVDVVKVYYGPEKPKGVFNKEQWAFDENETDPSKEIALLKKYRDMLIDFMTRAAAVIENGLSSKDSGTKKVQKELKRYTELTKDL